MAWTFVRPLDPSVLSGRPFLDIGTGDGQTLAALAPDGFGIDLEVAVLRKRPRVAAAEALALPFAESVFGCALAADVFHHLDDEALTDVVGEAMRVLRPEGSLVAWWYAESGVPAPDAPKYPRDLKAVQLMVENAGFTTRELDFVQEAGPKTVGLIAER